MILYEKEIAFWNSIRLQDKEVFLNLVAKDATMVYGSFSCAGEEFAEAIEEMDLAYFDIQGIEEIPIDENILQMHYQFITDTESFHATSTWKKIKGSWVLVFHMDARTE